MITYDHDEFFAWLDEGSPGRRADFSSIFDQMVHPDREHVQNSKADGILRSHFIEIGKEKQYLRIEVLYVIDGNDVKMRVYTVTVFDDVNQMELYKSMEQTMGTDSITGNAPQMN